MSGHSKWHQIRHKKGITDKKKGQVFSKISRMIQVAAREGSNPETNFKLRLAIDKAKEVNMPKENIARAIKKGVGKAEGEEFREAIFEGYGPGGVALLIETLTDNKNRTSSEIKNILAKFGGHLGEAGSVAWMFEKRGVIRADVSKQKDIKEEASLLAIDVGALDIKEEKDALEIYTQVHDFEKVKEALGTKGIEIDAEILMIPTQFVKIEDEKIASSILRLVESLEELDDVQSVSSNFDIPDDLMEKLIK